MILYEFIAILICGLLAVNNAHRIAGGNKINHWLNGLIHLSIAGGAWYIFHWVAAIIILLNARVLFDATLSYLRFGRINYVSLSPSSLIDKIERKIFGNDGYAPKIIYLLISISVNVIYYLKIKN